MIPLRKIEFEANSCAGQVDREYMAANERMMEIVFDPDYAEHLDRCNGGTPIQCLFRVGSMERMIDRFLCIVSDYETNEKFGWYDVGVVWGLIQERLNNYLVPFATLFAGDKLCFDYEDVDMEKREKPRVVVWYHEESPPNQPTTEIVANSFREFLHILYAKGENPIALSSR